MDEPAPLLGVGLHSGRAEYLGVLDGVSDLDFLVREAMP
jgi:hypothetical protein